MSHALSLVRIFTHNPERIKRVMKWYIHHRNLYIKGNAEWGSIRNMVSVQTLMVTWLFLKSIFPVVPSIWLYIGIPLCIAGRILCGWGIGWWWDRNRLYDREADWQNARNPVLDGLDRKILKEEDK